MAFGDAARKVPRTIHVTARQDRMLNEEAQRVGISVGDQIRRALDEWAERVSQGKTLASKVYQR